VILKTTQLKPKNVPQRMASLCNIKLKNPKDFNQQPKISRSNSHFKALLTEKSVKNNTHKNKKNEFIKIQGFKFSST
jgi:hypothetical protein